VETTLLVPSITQRRVWAGLSSAHRQIVSRLTLAMGERKDQNCPRRCAARSPILASLPRGAVRCRRVPLSPNTAEGEDAAERLHNRININRTAANPP